MKYFFKEPMIIFILLAGGIFIVFDNVAVNLPEVNAPQEQLNISDGRIKALIMSFEKTWQRKPDIKELKLLIQRYVKEEVLYREALAMGLDKNDGIIRRRLSQKMEFISEDMTDIETPDDTVLAQFLVSHAQDYQLPTQLSFLHIYLDPKQHGEALSTDIKRLEKLLETRTTDGATDVASLGDSLMLSPVFNEVPAFEVERQFGKDFANTLLSVSLNKWQGPITSGFGLHWVYISRRTEGGEAKLDQVRRSVERDWRSEKRKQINEQLYQNFLGRYIVNIAPYKHYISDQNQVTKQKIAKADK